MLKLRDLATRADFAAGSMTVSPSRRQVTGPAGSAHLEPLIMQVLLLLLDSGGRVVTRDEMFDQLWGGAGVGDDSLNRAVAKVRKATDAVAPGALQIETIPRTGYRLTGPDFECSAPPKDSGIVERTAISRRAMIASAGAAVAVVGGAALWSVRDKRDRFDALVDSAVDDLDYGDPSRDPSPKLRQAVAMRPADARAQGLLAFSLMTGAETAFNRRPDLDVQAAQRAAETALSIDPKQPEAQLATIMLQKSILDMETTESRLRTALVDAPDNVYVLRALWNLLQCGGRSQEALRLVNKAIRIKPLAASNNYPHAQLLWIVGRSAEADRVIDSALSYWPDHWYVRFARFTIFAFAGRPRAALAMISRPETQPQNFSPASIALWRKSLPALERNTSAGREDVRKANIEAAQQDPRLTGQAVLTLSALGEVDAAFSVANMLLLFRQAAEAKTDAPSGAPSKSTAWRFTPWLFTPPCSAMRADPRFAQLCEGIGLTDYWRSRGVRPDFMTA
jgi:DNA-binding winged helix-turn-helix (wHTH) protein/tetratricopeptide (TPR) repeat protein